MLHIYVDADACPVKQEVYRVAARCKLPVTLVTNSRMRIPEGQGITLEVVGGGFDEADNWIVEHVEANDIVITADIPLAARCLKKGAYAIGTSGKPFREDSIGHAIAMRELMSDLRAGGEITGGPPPLTDRDRSNFLQTLDQAVQNIRRKTPPKPA